MLAIKLQRVGKKHQPSYRFVVAERRSKMAGPPVEDLGSYNPFTKISSLNKERVSYWIKMGAKPTVSVHNLLIEQKVIAGTKVVVKMNKPEVKAPEAEAPKVSNEKAAEPVVSAEPADSSSPSVGETETASAA